MLYANSNDKVSFIDIDFILKNSNLGKSILNEIENLNKKNIDELRNKEKELKKIEAEIKSKKLRENDPNHDIFVGPVGIWVPWDPDAYKTGRVEYLEDELNALHKEKNKNEEEARKNFEERVRESKKKAIAENIEKAKQNKNVLTQKIDEEGNLIGVKETVDFDSREVADAESMKLHNEMLLEAAKKGESSAENELNMTLETVD